MRIGIIQASSQTDKNGLIFETVRKHAGQAEVFNFGCFGTEETSYSYIEISVMTGLLLASGSVDLIVTGCSSGQGMMLACNSMPGVLCGYIPSPEDAYLFAQINNGNAVSLPLGEEYTWKGADNLDQTLERLFSAPFGQGYPRSEAERKLKDTELLKDIRKKSQTGFSELFESLDSNLIRKVLTKKDVVQFVLENGKDGRISELIRSSL